MWKWHPIDLNDIRDVQRSGHKNSTLVKGFHSILFASHLLINFEWLIYGGLLKLCCCYDYMRQFYFSLYAVVLNKSVPQEILFSQDQPWNVLSDSSGTLTHCGRDKMAAIFQTTFSNAFSWMKMFKLRLRFHWSLFQKGPMNNIPALVQIMAWRRPGDKPLSEAMMVSILTHICVSRLQWVKYVHWVDSVCHMSLAKSTH